MVWGRLLGWDGENGPARRRRSPAVEGERAPHSPDRVSARWAFGFCRCAGRSGPDLGSEWHGEAGGDAAFRFFRALGGGGERRRKVICDWWRRHGDAHLRHGNLENAARESQRFEVGNVRYGFHARWKISARRGCRRSLAGDRRRDG